MFSKPKRGVRKIVISTNLAETSITIDDCVFVVDAGRMKEKRFDPVKNMESLDTVRVWHISSVKRIGCASGQTLQQGVSSSPMQGHFDRALRVQGF